MHRGRGNGFHGREQNNGFNNPSMAPSVKVINPSVDKEIQRKLEEFSQDMERPCLIFPCDFSRAERKRVHELALRYGLNSYSQGRDPNRKCIVRHRKVNMMSSVSAQETQPIGLSSSMRAKIREFIRAYPISDFDITKHNSSKATKSRSNHRKENQRSVTYPQVPPHAAGASFRSQREQLPAYAKRAEILRMIHEKQVVLITGGTGCGKTTQIPQFLLEDANLQQRPLRIICTQPRRLPAIAVAERVAKERGEQLGNTVGYHIRLEQRTSEKTVLTYCTSGVLLRMLTQEDAVHSMTHIILDEIHEREQNTDYLLIALKQALRKESKIKVILMSATMEGNIEMFKRYFDVPVHHIDIPSRLYNVEKFFLGDVLAMTGYCPPDSIWCTGGFNSSSNSNSFQMSQWGGGNTTAAASSNNMYMAQGSAQPSFGLHPQQQQQIQTNQDLYSNVAQQLATSQSSYMQHQQYPQPNGQYGQANDNYSQHGMSHAHTWASGMDKGGGNMPDVVNLTSTSEDIQIYNQGFQDHDWGHYGQDQNNWHQSQHQQQNWGGADWSQSQQSYSGHQPYNNQMNHMQNNQMSYFRGSMDGTVSYEPPPPQRSISQSALGSTFPAHCVEDAFGAALRREQMEKQQKKKYLQDALPNRPQFFSPNIRQIIRESGHPNTSDLPSIYMDLGGQQHADGIDAELVVAVAKHCIDSVVPGSILIFLPGYDDINEVKDRITAQCIGLRHKPQIFTLHSQMNSADQQKVFESIDSSSRKVILSTNIAEASLTIDDVVFVIDTGKVKEKTYDHNSRISQLKVTPIARSNAEQRSGRAGRCREGFCFRLYSAQDYERMLPTQTAEMQRSAIHDVCLHAKMFAPDNMTVRQFLQMAPEPPPPTAIDNSMTFLEQLGALYSEASTSDLDRPVRGFGQINMDQKEPEMTPLGRVIAQLPLEPQLARLLLFGLSLKCFSSVITLVAALSHRDPFLLPLSEERDKANASRDHFGGQDYSDHLSLLRAINEYESKAPRETFGFCRANFLSVPGMKMILGIRRQLLCEMKRCQLIEYDGDPNSALIDPRYNQYSDCWPMVQVAIVAGCYPGLGFTKPGSKMRKIRTTSEKNATLHPSSIIKRQLMTLTKMSNATNPGPQIEYLAFHEFTKLDEGLTLRNVTAVPPLPLVLSAGGLHMKQSVVNDFRIPTGPDGESDDENEPEQQDQFMTQQIQNQILELEEWICVRGPSSTMRDIVRLRFKLMSYFLSVIADPRLLRETNNEHSNLLRLLSEILVEDHQRQKFDPVKNIAPTPKVSSYNQNWNRPQQSQQNSDQYNDIRRNNSAQNFVQYQAPPQEQQQYRAPPPQQQHQQQMRDTGNRQEQRINYNHGQERRDNGQYRNEEENRQHPPPQQSYNHDQQQPYRRVDPNELIQQCGGGGGREAAPQEQKVNNDQERRQYNKYNQDDGYQQRNGGGGYDRQQRDGNRRMGGPPGHQDIRFQNQQQRDSGEGRNERRDNYNNSNGRDWRNNGESSSYDRSNDRGGGYNSRDDGNGKFSRGGNNHYTKDYSKDQSNGYNGSSLYFKDNGGGRGGGNGGYYNNGGGQGGGRYNKDKPFDNHDQQRQGNNRPFGNQNTRRPMNDNRHQNEDIPDDPKTWESDVNEQSFSRQGSQSGYNNGGPRNNRCNNRYGGQKKNDDFGKNEMVFTNSARKSNSKSGSVNSGRY